MTWKKLLNSKLFLLAVLVLFAYVSYYFIYELQKRQEIENEISRLRSEILNLEKNNKDLTDMIGYFRSPSFQEKELRTKLNLQKPGEHAVALPDAGKENMITGGEATSTAQEANWKKWWNYFFK